MVLTVFFVLADKIRDASVDKSMAYLEAQDFISERLLRPSTVKYPPMSTYEVTVKYLGRQRYFVAGYLDSLNTFGNSQRSNYSCIIRYIGAGEWVCERIAFE